MKKTGIIFFLIALLISCKNNDEQPTDNYQISDGCYEGYFDYRDTSYWCSLCFDKGKYVEWPSGGARYQKSMGCLTVGTYSIKGNNLTFMLGSYKYSDYPEPCTANMLLPGSYEITPVEKADSLIFKKGTGDDQIAYYLKRHEDLPENHDVPLSVDEFVGSYCGWDSESNGGGAIMNSEIIVSEVNNSKLIIKYFPGIGKDVEVSIDGDAFLIYPQSFAIKSYAHGAGVWSYDTLTIKGLGNYNQEDGLMTIDYNLEHAYPKVENHHIEAYNYRNHYKVSGTYSGEARNEVIIKNENNSLILSISYVSGSITYHWENIIGHDSGCVIEIPEQKVLEMNSGVQQTIRGLGQKDKNALNMFLSLSPRDESMDFVVIKCL